LENIDLAVQEAKYQGELDLASERVRMMKLQAVDAARADIGLRAQEEVRASAASMLQQIQAKRAQLLVRSPRDGVIIEPPGKPVSKAAIAEGQLPGWAGSPFAPANSEAVFSEGDVLCVVGEPGSDHRCRSIGYRPYQGR
jgi:hypothetical protein